LRKFTGINSYTPHKDEPLDWNQVVELGSGCVAIKTRNRIKIQNCGIGLGFVSANINAAFSGRRVFYDEIVGLRSSDRDSTNPDQISFDSTSGFAGECGKRATLHQEFSKPQRLKISRRDTFHQSLHSYLICISARIEKYSDPYF
jgi:hypothetical protein